jgi:cytochrome c
MKLKFILSGSLAIALFAAAPSYAQTAKATASKPAAKTATAQKPVASKQEIEEGKQLISKSDCMACHNLTNKMVGPAYVEVAKKYAMTDANVNTLAQKVIAGGSGVWGQIPMSPHPAMPAADAKKIVKYILSLNQ